MPKIGKRSVTPEKVAEQAKKNWKAVPIMPSDMNPGDKPDASTPELEVLRKRLKIPSHITKKQTAKRSSKASMVPLQPPPNTDTGVGRKISIIEGDKKSGYKKIGEQG